MELEEIQLTDAERRMIESDYIVDEDAPDHNPVIAEMSKMFAEPITITGDDDEEFVKSAELDKSV